MSIEIINSLINAMIDEKFPEKSGKAVFGEGKSCRPVIMMTGEAPGGNEEKLGRPFVGKAGENLNSFLEKVNLDRSEIYVTNAVKIRPVKISQKGTVSNRTPTKNETEMFLPYLAMEMQEVMPKVIVTLGNVPLHAVMEIAGMNPAGITIGNYHGKLTDIKIGGVEMKLFPLYHPASIIYNQKLREVCDMDYAALSRVIRDN